MEEALLQKISEVLKIPVEAFQNFDKEQEITVIANIFNTHDQSSGVSVHPITNVNPIKKWIEALEEIKDLMRSC